MWLARDPRVTVARVELRLTMYLVEPAVWASGGATAMLRAFLKTAGPERLNWFTTSLLDRWEPIGPAGLDTLVERTIAPWHQQVRHLFGFQLVDDPGAPSKGFTYREIDPGRSRRTGVLEMILPNESEPDDLLTLAAQAGDLPFASGIGGYAVVWNPLHKATAFGQAHRWCKRFVGLDLQDPEQMAWHAWSALPGTNWLTLVGQPVADTARLDLSGLQRQKREDDISVTTLKHGTLVCAGAEPSLGDLNVFDPVPAYAEVARALAPGFVKEIEYWGTFTANGDTKHWLRRFIEPRGWA